MILELEDAKDICAARAALADRGPDISLDEVLAKFADDLAAQPGDQ